MHVLGSLSTLHHGGIAFGVRRRGPQNINSHPGSKYQFAPGLKISIHIRARKGLAWTEGMERDGGMEGMEGWKDIHCDGGMEEGWKDMHCNLVHCNLDGAIV